MKKWMVLAAAMLVLPVVAEAQEISTSDIVEQIRRTVGNARPGKAGKTRGISRSIDMGDNGVDAERDPIEPPAPGAPECQVLFNFYHILFSRGSAVLSGDRETRQTLAALARGLADPEFADLNFHVRGHTDATGSPSRNDILSIQRAEAVARELAFLGAPGRRLQAEGKGSSILADPDDPNGPSNRRVDVCIFQ